MFMGHQSYTQKCWGPKVSSGKDGNQRQVHARQVFHLGGYIHVSETESRNFLYFDEMIYCHTQIFLPQTFQIKTDIGNIGHFKYIFLCIYVLNIIIYVYIHILKSLFHESLFPNMKAL